MEWIAIFELVVSMIQECQKRRQSSGDIKDQLRSPGPFARVVFVRRLRRKTGCSRAEATDALDKAIAEAVGASDAEIDSLIEEAGK